MEGGPRARGCCPPLEVGTTSACSRQGPRSYSHKKVNSVNNLSEQQWVLRRCGRWLAPRLQRGGPSRLLTSRTGTQVPLSLWSFVTRGAGAGPWGRSDGEGLQVALCPAVLHLNVDRVLGQSSQLGWSLTGDLCQVHGPEGLDLPWVGSSSSPACWVQGPSADLPLLRSSELGPTGSPAVYKPVRFLARVF